jgi:hypothetical protein
VTFVPRFARNWAATLGDAYVLGFARALVGIFLFWQALKSAQELSAFGYFGDVFHLPFIPEALVPSRAVYVLVVGARLVLAALVVVGHRPRASLVVSGLLVLYVILCDRLEYHHNRYALACYAVLLGLAPCDRSFSLAATSTFVHAPRIAPMWAARLAQIQVSIVYVASGGAKLFDPDWREGLVLYARLARYGHHAVEMGVPAGLVAFLSRADTSSALAKLAIATELFLAVGLWLETTRVPALWWGVWFHLVIEVTSQVELFTWVTLTMYTLFATPDVGARKLYFDPTRRRAVVYARLVAAFDWLARFDVRPWAPDAMKKGHVLVVVRRDGTRATGIRALCMITRCVPLLFPLWGVMALVASFTKGGEAPARA